MQQRRTVLYDFVKRIPKGKVITYGGLARAIRLPGGAREAGHAMAACPRGLGVPWHRVVGAGGRLLIREPHAGLQRKLLAGEGVCFRGTVVDLARHEWSRAAAKSRRERKSRTE